MNILTNIINKNEKLNYYKSKLIIQKNNLENDKIHF